MNSYSYIFLLRRKEVSVFRFRDNAWEPITRDGLASFPFRDTQDLIDWWKEEASYSEGKVDLLFLSDEQSIEWDQKLVDDTFQFAKEESVWSFKRLKEFFKQFDEMEQVTLVVSDTDTAPYNVKNTTGRPAPGSSYQFYPFPQLEKVEADEPPAQPVRRKAKPTKPSEMASKPAIPVAAKPTLSSEDDSGDILFRYFRSNLENYEK